MNLSAVCCLVIPPAGMMSSSVAFCSSFSLQGRHVVPKPAVKSSWVYTAQTTCWTPPHKASCKWRSTPSHQALAASAVKLQRCTTTWQDGSPRIAAWSVHRYILCTLFVFVIVQLVVRTCSEAPEQCQCVRGNQLRLWCICVNANMVVVKSTIIDESRSGRAVIESGFACQLAARKVCRPLVLVSIIFICKWR